MGRHFFKTRCASCYARCPERSSITSTATCKRFPTTGHEPTLCQALIAQVASHKRACLAGVCACPHGQSCRRPCRSDRTHRVHERRAALLSQPCRGADTTGIVCDASHNRSVTSDRKVARTTWHRCVGAGDHGAVSGGLSADPRQLGRLGARCPRPRHRFSVCRRRISCRGLAVVLRFLSRPRRLRAVCSCRLCSLLEHRCCSRAPRTHRADSDDRTWCCSRRYSRCSAGGTASPSCYPAGISRHLSRHLRRCCRHCRKCYSEAALALIDYERVRAQR